MKRAANRSKPSAYWKALSTLGIGWAMQRARFVLLAKSGALVRRTPPHRWQGIDLANLVRPGVPANAQEYFKWRQDHSPAFLTDAFPGDAAKQLVGPRSVEAADRILSGEFPYFSYTKVIGYPPKWLPDSNPTDSVASRHWSSVDEFASDDIKLWWEPSRFSWAFALGRAYARSGDERYPEAFWSLVESWMANNEPYQGLNWKCGQEAAFRAMALCFGYYSTKNSASSTPERIQNLVRLIARLATRIDAYIEYARSQKNNHGISEAAGLWTVGLLFPELRDSQRWRKRGKSLLEYEVRRQIYDDGSYVQHSLNYHRVMLQDVAWSLRLGGLNGDPFAEDISNIFLKGVRFLYALTDSDSGWAPNYGANDGALVLPLSDCDFPDMRPVLQSCHLLAKGQKLFAPGIWDEESAWLNGSRVTQAAAPAASTLPAELSAPTGGYYSLRSKTSWAFVRGANYRDRPSHADQLNVDLWWRGSNVLCDAGTYSYNSPPPFDHGFASARYHNTVTIDDRDQMTRLGSFLWADWSSAKVERADSVPNQPKTLLGTHTGYAKCGLIHRRALINSSEDIWIVVDDLVGTGTHTLRLHWLAPDSPVTALTGNTFDIQSAAGPLRISLASTVRDEVDLVRAGSQIVGAGADLPDPARGWISRHYGRKEPALSFALECYSPLPVRFASIVQLGALEPVTTSASLEDIQAQTFGVHLSPVGVWPITTAAA